MAAYLVVLLALGSLVIQVGVACAEEKMPYGEAEYLNSCAACHGLHGRGDGALATVLNKTPADLTLLSQKNGGEFPYFSVFAVIDGRYIVPGHGERDMPVWGRQFIEEDAKTYGPIGGEAVTQERIHALTGYVASLQR